MGTGLAEGRVQGLARAAANGEGIASWWDSHAPLPLGYYATNFPCRAACPVGTNAGGYVSLIAQGRYQEAYALARRPNPFASVCGRICAHPCEAACRRQQIDAPIQIRALKRFVNERFGVESRHSFEEILMVVERPRPPAERPGRVAVLGAGPAGLSCAHDLRLMGHEVVVFDAARIAGGMLRLGVPEYRLPREVVDREIDFIRWLGADIRLEVQSGRDVRFEDLRRQFDAIFLAVGCRKGKSLRIPGADLQGVLSAVDFLAHVNLGVPIRIGERVVVVGGGSVAFDVARTARRFGGTALPDEEHHQLAVDAALVAARVLRRDVTMVVLESRDEMPADPLDIEEGAEEGIRLLNRRGPKEILGGSSHVGGWVPRREGSSRRLRTRSRRRPVSSYAPYGIRLCTNGHEWGRALPPEHPGAGWRPESRVSGARRMVSSLREFRSCPVLRPSPHHRIADSRFARSRISASGIPGSNSGT
jgi:hypothetical protein